MSNTKATITVLLTLLVTTATFSQSRDAFDTKTTFQVGNHWAFTMVPSISNRKHSIPWVWYAPTLGEGLPGQHERWMFNMLHSRGIAIAGIDVGESYGSPAGAAAFDDLYAELTTNRQFAQAPVLLGRSRGGLMLYSWAVRNPQNVAAIAGIYPVCNLVSYPGVTAAAPAFDLTAEKLQLELNSLNPIEMLEPLANAEIPIFHIHGDMDTVVPLESNSALLAKRIHSMGGDATIKIIKGQGHNLWPGWFNDRSLTSFMIKHAKLSVRR
ncbi:MAG: alpha/beta hydrolase [Planctomycetaceae bacterium]|nr:alpha/beta hydrolase [Planctomycetaceae bacterium]